MANKPNPPAKPVVVFHGAAAGDNSGSIPRVMFAVICSFAFNGVVIFGFVFASMFLSIFQLHATTDATTEVVETTVEDNSTAPNLENDEIGLDPTVQTNYNVDRIEEVSVPGPVQANEAVGIPGAPEATPTTLPPPPGVGGNIGHGAGIDDPNKIGTGAMNGLAGGLGGPKMIPGGFGGRSGATRVKMLNEGGGNAFSEAAVAAGLAFLAAHQGTDGRWSLNNFNQLGKCNCTGKATTDNDVAATAFGLLPFLGSGQTHKGGSASGNKYTKQVDIGLKYLLLKENREGEFNPNMYSQGLATMAVCEAYGLTSDPALRNPAQRALNYIIDAQSAEGGWRYARRSPGYDTSVGGWQLMALKSGQMSGLTVPPATLKRCNKWLDHAASADGGGFGYVANSLNDPRPNETPTLSAVGLLCRQYLGYGPRNPALLVGVKRLQQVGPQTNNMYMTYYATQVMHHLGGNAWEIWNPKMRDGLIAAQDTGKDAQHPHQKGSWHNAGDSISGGYGGRMMCTSMSILCLEVYYRHLPLYRRDVGGDKDVMNGNQ
jgi:hypothetical protein